MDFYLNPADFQLRDGFPLDLDFIKSAQPVLDWIWI